jgi:hypothetical protein
MELDAEHGRQVREALLRIMDDSDMCLPFLKYSLSLEFSRILITPPTNPFATASPAAALASSALTLAGSRFLIACLGPLVEQVAHCHRGERQTRRARRDRHAV